MRREGSVILFHSPTETAAYASVREMPPNDFYAGMTGLAAFTLIRGELNLDLEGVVALAEYSSSQGAEKGEAKILIIINKLR